MLQDIDLQYSGGIPTFGGPVAAAAVAANGLTGATAATRYAGGTSSGAPASGTFASGDFVIDESGQVLVCVTAGSPGTWSTLTGPNHALPSSHGFKAWAYDPSFASTGSLGVSGTLYLSALYIERPVTVSTLWWAHTTAGSGATSGENFGALISSSGTILASAGADAKVTVANSTVSLAVGSTPLSPGWVWGALLWNATTPPTMVRTNGALVALNDANQSAASYRYATAGTGLTALPASITPSSNSQTGAASLWMAVS